MVYYSDESLYTGFWTTQLAQGLQESAISSLNVISWDINRGFNTKCNDQGLRSYCFNCYVIFLCECWFENKFISRVDGFKIICNTQVKNKINSREVVVLC